MTIQFLDPMAGPVQAEVELAPRPADPASLQKIALLNNGKPNSDKVLQFVAEALQQRYPHVTWEMITKPSSFKPAPEKVLAQSAAYGAVITGVGD